ncbi:MAG TPA: pyridoxamine 5'-phosphate oxidase family protein [Pyrinomonadaceae bacterium]|nr:pyridoxamine 5'-phosphate oxidase family protein [Pyrinomonadaceae bacterium]
MVTIEDMSQAEIEALLEKIGFGHLGCARDNRPYVVPMHYSYEDQNLYFFTTEGMKTACIDSNSEVCFQVEEIDDPSHWRSVMVFGRAERLTKTGDVEHAMQAITARNPSLTPAINKTQLDAWGRANNVLIYRLHPDSMDGRKTVS